MVGAMSVHEIQKAVSTGVMKFSIRKMGAGDTTAVAELSEEGFRRIYRFDWEQNAKALFDTVKAGRCFVAVAESERQVVGYGNLRSWPAGGWVDQIVVSKSCQGQGIGRALLESIIAEAHQRGYWKVSLITSEADPGVLSFFRTCGWVEVGSMKDEIARGVNGILLSRIVDYELHPNR